MSKPDMTPLYGAAFGFNTHRRIKPVHLATGFFVAVLGKKCAGVLLNNVVAFADGKELTGNYALENLHPELTRLKRIGSSLSPRDLHTLRKHL
jgi:hypothetical protein